MTPMLKPKLHPTSLYLGDNGRCFCGALACAGMSSYYTGRDISGQDVLPLSTECLRPSEQFELRCEGCGLGLDGKKVPRHRPQMGRVGFNAECVICQNEGAHDLNDRQHVMAGQE